MSTYCIWRKSCDDFIPDTCQDVFQDIYVKTHLSICQKTYRKLCQSLCHYTHQNACGDCCRYKCLNVCQNMLSENMLDFMICFVSLFLVPWKCIYQHIYKCHYCEFNMHLHLFMICVHVFVKVEITRSEVAAETIQFAESFSWTRTKWKNSSVCGSGVEPEKVWPSCNPLGAHQNDGRDENMFQFRRLPNPSLLEKNQHPAEALVYHWFSAGFVHFEEFRWQWVTRGADVISSGLAPRK